MTKKAHCHVFTSESVSEGHPDKVADQISDAILDACLKADSKSHVACETMVGPDVVVNMGEITCKGWKKIDPQAIARRIVKKIGYDRPDEHFSYDTFQYYSHLHEQSPDIAQGVNRKVAKNQGAGDQGMMFGYATNETKSFMPASIFYSHELLKMYARLRKRGGKYAWLRPDAKSQLSVVYENGVPVRIDTVVISHQTTEAGATKQNYAEIERLAKDYLSKTGLLAPRTKFFINPTGKFLVGGPSSITLLRRSLRRQSASSRRIRTRSPSSRSSRSCLRKTVKLIASFQVDHTRIVPGIYVSRRDKVAGGWITTFDVRMKTPNKEPAIHPNAMHTIEHVVATYLRNSAFKDHVVYWGPMGCLTGFYFITSTEDEIQPRDIEKLIRAAYRYQASYKGEVPGATAVNCGNYLLHDLPMAKWEAKRFLAQKWCFEYPKARRIVAKGKTFFDA